jgi:hypothetical protein
MIVTYTAKFTATDMNDAVEQSTERWRALVGDPEAKLPWGATILVMDDNGTKEVTLNVSTDHDQGAA